MIVLLQDKHVSHSKLFVTNFKSTNNRMTTEKRIPVLLILGAGRKAKDLIQ
jgi:hypothetical protein